MNIHTVTLMKRLTYTEYKAVTGALFDQNNCKPGLSYRVDDKLVVSNVFKGYGIKISVVRNKFADGGYNDLVYIKINLHNVINKEKSRVNTFHLGKKNIRLLEKQFNQLFCIFPDGLSTINDYYLIRIDLCHDVKLEGSQLRAYLRAANGCFLPVKAKKSQWYDKIGKKYRSSKHRVELVFPSCMVVMYDKKWQLDHCGIFDYDSNEAAGILRFEVALKKNAIRTLIKSILGNYRLTEVPPVALLMAVNQSGVSEIIFFEWFKKVFFCGDYFPLKDIRLMIKDSSFKNKTKTKMIELVELTAKHSSIERAINDFNGCSNENEDEDWKRRRKKALELLKKCDLLGVNPFPLSARYEGDFLPSIPKLLLSSLD